MTGRHRRIIAAAAVIAALGSCATGNSFFGGPGTEAYRNGSQLIEKGQVEEGLAELERALKAEPGNVEYRAALVRGKSVHLSNLLAQADSARAGQYLDLAEARYRRALELDPGNERARAGIESVRLANRHKTLIAEAEKSIKAEKLEEAVARLNVVLAENPAQPAARALKRKVDEQLYSMRVRRTLSPAFRKPVTVEFRDAGLRSIFEVLSRLSGINFVFDKDVRPDIRTTVFLRNISIDDALGLILATNQLERKIVNENTILVYPNTPAKLKEYQELMVRTFYLANADVKQTLNMIRTLVKTRDIFIDEKLNMLTMRDTPQAVRLAEKLIAAQDLAEPEVVLELEVLEIKRSKLLDLGIVWPTQFTVLNIVQDPTQTVTTGGATTTTSPQTTTTTTLTLENLRNLRSGNVAISPNPQANIRQDDSDANILANPRIRVKNREKARVHIGDKVPVITTVTTANVGVSESVSYLDIGLKLDVEPNVFLEQDVAIKMGLEVSSIVREVTSRQGTLTYQVGTRTAATVLRVKDGETQVLAGLISDEERRNASGLPWLGQLPLIGRLFAHHRDEKVKTEIMLLVTPRVVRNLPQLEVTALEYLSGTEAASGAEPLRIEPSGAIAIPPQADAPGAPKAAPFKPVPAQQPAPDKPAPQ